MNNNDFFTAAVVGPLSNRLFSIVASCTECAAADKPETGDGDKPETNKGRCSGFGPGCLVSPRRTER
jgi:hypothetical protein